MKALRHSSIEEFIKYDHNSAKWPLTMIGGVVARVLGVRRSYARQLSIVSAMFRVGWRGSSALAVATVDRLYLSDSKAGENITEAALADLGPCERTSKFFNDPKLMLDGIVTVLRNPGDASKGVIIINYNAYFLPFLKFYDVEKILERFHLILEPSWAGLCEADILAFTQFKAPILVQAYEPRDFAFIEQLRSNLIPVDVGPSWFINHDMFHSPEAGVHRPIDLIMVAGWARFKRHQAFFTAIAPLVKQDPNFRIALVGYPVDLTKEDIQQMAADAGVQQVVEFYEWVTPTEVADLLRQSKASVLWSKFEGNNRAIIESMLCDTPVVMREGHNYGVKYDFVNEHTGQFASENDLCDVVSGLIERQPTMRCRNYIMEHRSAEAATERLAEAIDAIELLHPQHRESPSPSPLAVKVNELHGMSYFRQSGVDFKESYTWLGSHVLK
ncbi:glycosyltransferase [Congregibacter litoralis]|uniref:glycosyltransferase n=1 Tax=Congregibacter litoralis TaxID=393662 RepID=UPI0012603187|nr:glycosyltransferase [Congregibacter litoralis]